jgi:hypothetical protein
MILLPTPNYYINHPHITTSGSWVVYVSHIFDPTIYINSNLDLHCVFIGYALSQKGYKCLDLATNKIYISCHVLFDESHFPFATTHHAQPDSPPPDILQLLGLLQKQPTQPLSASSPPLHFSPGPPSEPSAQSNPPAHCLPHFGPATRTSNTPTRLLLPPIPSDRSLSPNTSLITSSPPNLTPLPQPEITPQ